ncbi:MAG: glycosyltransferase family 39 protein [Lachnospiraceae bacterium]|nr:glycosyltransferase family 39 protein [Lachnospiraceae bacterium]
MSSCLNILGSSFISLRGLSIIAATANVILLYSVMKEFVSKELATVCTIVYICAGEVNKLAIQGRGYTLAVTCLLISLLNLTKIIKSESVKRKHFIAFAVSLAYGLYVLPSSVYWVLPICVSGGLYLLLTKKYNSLVRLILYALLAALATFMLYSVVWLATGANYISKDSSSAFYGMNQAIIAVKEPVRSWIRGFRAMMANPFIQPIERSDVISGMAAYFKYNIFHSYYAKCGLAIIVILALSPAYNFFAAVKVRSYKKFFHIYILMNTVLLPLILIVQSVLPFTRVMSFFMLIVAMALISLLDGIAALVKRVDFKRFRIAVYFLLVCAMAYLIVNNKYVACADRETQIYELLKSYDVSSLNNIFYTDDYQKYVIKYYFNETPQETNFENATYLIIYDGQISDEFGTPWPEMILFDKERMAYVEDNYIFEKRFGSYSLWKIKDES